jgi:hypothetical protein
MRAEVNSLDLCVEVRGSVHFEGLDSGLLAILGLDLIVTVVVGLSAPACYYFCFCSPLDLWLMPVAQVVQL